MENILNAVDFLLLENSADDLKKLREKLISLVVVEDELACVCVKIKFLDMIIKLKNKHGY